MDPNDIAARLSRLYAAVDATQDIDLQQHVERQRSVTRENTPQGTRGTITMEFRFNAKGTPDAQNVALAAIEKIIGLKDHLKRFLSSNGGNPQDVENLVNSSQHLSIALDLWNKEKHGTPLKFPRTSMDPSLSDVKRVMVLSGKKPSLAIFPGSGIVKSSGDVTIRVVGEVIDSSGSKILGLSELIENSLQEMEEFMSNHGVK